MNWGLFAFRGRYFKRLTSTKKYEQYFDDGKNFAHIREGVSLAKLLSLTIFAKDPIAMKDELLKWPLFNLLVGNTDAHSKNFSFLSVRPD